MMTKYHRHYQSLIENARNRILPNDTYTESHHIIPRSFGGSNDITNLVDLTAREHYIAHLLLSKMHGGEQRRKMLAAVVLMGAIKRFKTKCNSHLYESMRLAYITMCRDATCKKRERCYRFTARATPEYQSYFVDSPREGEVCKYFSDNEDKTKRLRKNCE